MKVNRSLKLDPSKIKFLFDWSWYDGPLNGALDYDGTKLWFTTWKRYCIKGQFKDVSLCFKLPNSDMAKLEEAVSSETPSGIDPPSFNTREKKKKFPCYGYFIAQEV